MPGLFDQLGSPLVLTSTYPPARKIATCILYAVQFRVEEFEGGAGLSVPFRSAGKAGPARSAAPAALSC